MADALARGDLDAASLPAAERAMLTYVQQLTLQPATMKEGDVQTLREAGFSDAAIGDVAANAALFAFMNRIVDGLGCSLPRGWDTEAHRLGIDIRLVASHDACAPKGDDDDGPQH